MSEMPMVTNTAPRLSLCRECGADLHVSLWKRGTCDVCEKVAFALRPQTGRNFYSNTKEGCGEQKPRLLPEDEQADE